ncbi:hypothetical protein A4X13_0g7964 [Tilletia indica]|uniref:Uncharacterized protein n=1 Tax=Tilletia indica TaxID=43049 RepID=A0A8T8SGJ0_9BASI|nr:hypothetical protein A4X13_0g7964 [Tilletia indica]
MADYEKEIDVKATRSEEIFLGPSLPASAHLEAVHDSTDCDIDAGIFQYNREFPRGSTWQAHLINLSTQFEPFLSEERLTVYDYERAQKEDLLGVRMFDDLRPTDAVIQSLPGFRNNFDVFSGSVLDNLDWTNVGVAGGSMLACLTESHIGELLRNSDIDLFIWGLEPPAMLLKLLHIKDTIVANVPNFSSKYVVERSAGALTFIPRIRDHGRKIQVVLRGYCNPAAVLASFDLDPACIFFDGDQVWLSLRAIRAFYTGYTTTSGAISSSFAARIIKYATRGYGVIVRPDENDPDTDELLLNMESTMRDKEILTLEHYLRFPWTGKNNYRALFLHVKNQVTTNWTHSFSALASLAALWTLAYKTGRIGELLDEVGAASHIYGLYEGSDAVMATLHPKEWLSALAKFSPSLRRRTWSLHDRVWKVNDPTMSGARLLLVVILPVGLRQYLQECGRFQSLTRLRDTDDVKDVDGVMMEICLWTVTGEKIWQPQDGTSSVAHQLLVTAAMVTAWTLWKVSAGAPWPKLHYNRAFHNAQVFSFNAALTRTGDFDDWIRD